MPEGHITGDKDFRMEDLSGVWYKVRAWKLGEPFECEGCQRARFFDNNDTSSNVNETNDTPIDSSESDNDHQVINMDGVENIKKLDTTITETDLDEVINNISSDDNSVSDINN